MLPSIQASLHRVKGDLTPLHLFSAPFRSSALTEMMRTSSSQGQRIYSPSQCLSSGRTLDEIRAYIGVSSGALFSMLIYIHSNGSSRCTNGAGDRLLMG